MGDDPYKLFTHVDGTGVVYRLSGEMDAFAVPDLAAAVDELPGSIRTVVVDLAGVTFIDASGIGALVRAHQAAVDRGSRLIIIGASDYVRQISTLAGATTLLGIRPRTWPEPRHPSHISRPGDETSGEDPAAGALPDSHVDAAQMD